MKNENYINTIMGTDFKKITKEELNNRSEKQIIKLLQKDPSIFKYIDSINLTYPICLQSIKSMGSNIEYIPEEFQTEELCLKVVKQDAFYIENITQKNITKKIYLEAYKTDKNIFNYIDISIQNWIKKIENNKKIDIKTMSVNKIMNILNEDKKKITQKTKQSNINSFEIKL